MEALHGEHAFSPFSDMFAAYLLARNIRYEEKLVDQLLNSSEKRLARVFLLLIHFGKECMPQSVVPKISQESHSGTIAGRISVWSPTNGARHDKATLAICEKAAEQGLPTAQIALAQLYAARRAGPRDLVHAYMWFLIAGEQINQAKNHLNQSMTMEQLLESEQRAAEWIRKMRKIPPSSIENPPNASTA